MPTFARLALLRIVVILGALALLYVIADNAPFDPTVPPASAATRTTDSVHYADCEDIGEAPCVTFDDGRWRLVKSYTPYRSVTLTKCTDGAKLPCVAPRDPHGRYRVIGKRGTLPHAAMTPEWAMHNLPECNVRKHVTRDCWVLAAHTGDVYVM